VSVAGALLQHSLAALGDVEHAAVLVRDTEDGSLRFAEE
jgi:hypothetical protein